jgi:DNA-directed RNA polymerase sigma subunit (sigma70/sigma32)
LAQEVISEVNRQVNALPRFERETVKHKLAFNGHALRGFEEIGSEFGVGRETTRKRYLRSLDRIRSGIELRGLAPA